MQAKPAKTSSKFPGSKSRYDDYQALHISQTDYIHFDVGIQDTAIPVFVPCMNPTDKQ